jgi:hypothetical protein
MKFFQRTGFGESKTFFGGPSYWPYMMGLGQANRAAPPSWIQLSAVLVNVYKQLNLGALIMDPITAAMIHSIGALFVDDTNLYTWREGLLDPGELWCQAHLELEQWSCLLNATGGALKLEKCFWYLLDYECKDGEWSYTEMLPYEMFITNPDGTKSPIKQETVTDSKKTLGIHDSPAGGNAAHLSSIKDKASVWVQRMQNGHLPCHIAWTAYKHQLWPGLRYGLGMMTNDIEPAEELLHAKDYKMLNVLGVLRNVTKGLRQIHTTFGGFGLLSLLTKQLISRVNMLMQHYHASTNLGRQLDASLQYLQLQLGTPHNPLTLDYAKWGQISPLCWVKMLWRSSQHFDIHLHMDFKKISFPRERDQVIMEIFFAADLSPEAIGSLG